MNEELERLADLRRSRSALQEIVSLVVAAIDHLKEAKNRLGDDDRLGPDLGASIERSKRTLEELYQRMDELSPPILDPIRWQTRSAEQPSLGTQPESPRRPPREV